MSGTLGFTGFLAVLTINPVSLIAPKPQTADISRFLHATQLHYMEKDFIILGDLNADCKYYNPKQPNPIPGTTWLVPESGDTTVKSTGYTYDRIIITDACREDFAGEVQVFRFDRKFGLSYKDAIEVSDHFPVWARFNTDRDTD